MKTVGVAKLKSTLSEQLASVRAGEEILVTDRGEPLARIVPISRASVSSHIKALARRGLVKLPTRPPIAVRPRTKDPERKLLTALLEERRMSR